MMTPDKIRQKYQLREESISLAGHELFVASVKNIDDLLDELISKGDSHEDVIDERIPYFADLWPSSIILAEFLLKNPELVAGKDVLEIGCGIGLAGTAAGMAGAASILHTDYLQDAIDFAAFVWQLNHPRQAKTALLDWRTPDREYSREVILAADIAYEERNFDPIISAFKQLLPPDGVIYLTEPSRQFARPFEARLSREGFLVSTTIQPVRFREMEHKIRLHRISHQKN